MRIDEVETFTAGGALYVRLTTDTGVQGIGESTCFGWPVAVEEVVRSFRSYLVGADPFDAEAHWLHLYRTLCFRGMVVVGAISAIDQALWDIRGRPFEVPVWQLLGGRSRRAVRAMKVIRGDSAAAVADAAAGAMAAGYTAAKVILYGHEHHTMRHAARLADLVERFTAIRDTVGWDLDVGIELHRNMAPGDAVQLCEEIAPLRPYFVEDPIPPDSVLAFGEVGARVRVPLAAGERNTTIWEFREYACQPGVSYLRPDVGVAGGITHVRKICALAEAHHQGILPHAVPSGPVATAAHVHLGIAVPNWEAQEHVEQDGGPASDLVKAVVPLVDGWLYPPDAPGLGVELDEEGLARTPVRAIGVGAPLREDGSVAIR
ncbi:mandelate racemase/muconate lactonizing enzyme family protein [Actinopolymorpha sp. B11F2]|uniref:mandelate racemase/muconate lactonizing enzyme family protein n=1 Tax=Actinopolymorpha sp. B11F2 TaxID=3160862 RepID=UPI0032E3E428